MKIKALFLTLFAVILTSLQAHAVDLGKIEKDLAGNGVTGWVHGEVADRNLCVFTYRNPDDFFDAIQMSLVTDDPAIAAQLAALKRNDKILVKGKFLKNPSPQKHIRVSEVQLLERYQNPYDPGDYEHEAKIPDELKNINEANFLVHAVAAGGNILVVEYKDQILPMYVHNASLTAGLYRNDIVTLRFHLQDDPDQPTHLVLNETDPQAVRVLQAVKDLNGKPADVEGALVLFPKSPEIIFNVFAVEDSSVAGIKRQFTLLNQDNPEVFKQIRDKLQAAWDRHAGKFVNGRNKLVSTVIRVRAKGIYQEIDPGQANAQILLQSADDIEVIE